jgi:nitrite reductase/ring-hydroxylating ferredoxin subunit
VSGVQGLLWDSRCPQSRGALSGHSLMCSVHNEIELVIEGKCLGEQCLESVSNS